MLRPPRLPPLCRDIERQNLRVRVMGCDKRHELTGGYLGAAEEYLGSAMHDLRPICDGQPHDLELQLRGSTAGSTAEAGENGGGSEGSSSSSGGGGSGGGGSMHLSCRFLPFSAVLAQDAAKSEMDAPVVLGVPGQVRHVLALR